MSYQVQDLLRDILQVFYELLFSMTYKDSDKNVDKRLDCPRRASRSQGRLRKQYCQNNTNNNNSSNPKGQSLDEANHVREDNSRISGIQILPRLDLLIPHPEVDNSKFGFLTKGSSEVKLPHYGKLQPVAKRTRFQRERDFKRKMPVPDI